MTIRGEQLAAAEIAARAWRQHRDAGNSTDGQVVHEALSAVARGYQAPIATDERRIAAWQGSLATVVRPGTLVLEIGTGSSIMAMLAARAGAEVISCENDPVMAALAEEVVRKNGFARRIRIVPKPVQELRVPQDLHRPADLLLLDLFSDNLFDFRPFDIIRAARPLLRPRAACLPIQISLQGALAEFRRWHRMVPDRVAGFDLSDLAEVAPMRVAIDASDPDILLRSAAAPLVSASLPDHLPAAGGTAEQRLTSSGGLVNGLGVWLRLDLGSGHILEARPGAVPRGYYSKLRFHAFRKAVQTEPGRALTVTLRWEDKRSRVSLTGYR